MTRAELIGRELRTLADAQQWFRDMHTITFDEIERAAASAGL